MRQPKARDSYRVARSPLDAFFHKGTPNDAVRYAAGTVTATDDDSETVTANIHGEEIPKIAILGDMPAVGDQVDIWATGDLLFVPAYGSNLAIVYVQPDDPDDHHLGTLWFDTDEPVP